MSAKATTRECPRCAGTGVLPARMYVRAGICFRCEGAGVVSPVAVDRAARALGARNTALRVALRETCERLDGGPNGETTHAVMGGLAILESREPARWLAAHESLAAGRTDAVIVGLRAYFAKYATND